MEDCLAQRYVFALLAAIGNGITYGLKVNFHISLVTMINQTASVSMTVNGSSDASHEDRGHDGGVCGAESSNSSNSSGGSHLSDGPFQWDSITQGILLSSYFYGYLVTPVVGGRLADLVSAKYTFGVSLLFNVFLALLSPVAARLGWPYLVAVRVLQGMAGGVTLPTTHALLARWSPVQERSRMSSIVYAGMSMGTVISVMLTGLLAGSFGWEMSFYLPAGLAMIPTIAWFFLIYDSPDVHPWISETEKQLIQGGSRPLPGSTPPLPWRALLKSKPFWAILISHVGNNFGWYMILTELPFYMSSILGFAIKSNAVLSAIPFLVMWLYSMVFGSCMDYLASKRLLTRTQVSKIATSVAAFVPAVSLVAVSYVGCQKTLAVVLLSVATGAMGSMYSGFLSNHIAIAPAHAGTLMAITNTAATVPGVIVPSFVGALLHHQNGVEQWRIIFGITAVVFVLHGIQYLFMASSEEQEWSKTAGTKLEQTTTVDNDCLATKL